MEILKVVNKLKELGSTASLSSSDKAEIEGLYLEVLDKKFTRTGCSDCYHDAVIEMSVYLNKHGKMKEKCSYKLKNGVLLQMEFGSTDFYTNDNLTDEVAEKYLGKYPDNEDYFAVLPEDWQERVQNRGKEYNDELLGYMTEALRDGVTPESIVEQFADYRINGRKVSKKRLSAHADKALEIVEAEKPVDEVPNETTEGNENPEADQTEGDKVEE